MELDDYEKDILEAYEQGEFVQVDCIEKEIDLARQAASEYSTKDSRINIRIASSDLNILKRLAKREGLPYQTFVSSLLHKFATGGF